MKLYDHICISCQSPFKSEKDKHKICIFCYIKEMNFYDLVDFDHAVEHLLDMFRMDQKFIVKCRKCGIRFETSKRTIFVDGFLCYPCRCNDEEHKKRFQELLDRIDRHKKKVDAPPVNKLNQDKKEVEFPSIE